MTKQQMREIVKADNARRAAREAEENKILGITLRYSPCPDGVDPYLWDRSITGVPSQRNRDYKATTNCWNRGLKGRTFGAAGDNHAANTLKVIRDGVERIAEVSEFRGKRATRAAVRVSRTIAPEVASLPSIRAGETY